MAYRRLVVLTAVMVACGIDESGLLPGDGSVLDAAGDVVMPSDGGKDVVIDVPMSCTTLDVSACVDSGIPDGWAPIVTSTTVGSCPTSVDYTQTNYVDKIAASGACTCACAPSGTFACTGTVQWASNNNCGFSTATAIDAGGPGCYSISNHQDFSFAPVSITAQATGESCDASTATTPSVTSTGVTVCAAQCTADYCHVNTSSFSRCIWSATATTCPAPFVNQDTIGQDADTTVACGCGCSTRQVGNCTGGSVSEFAMGGCAGGAFQDASSDGGKVCTDTGGTMLNSFSYQPGPAPTVGCDPSGGSSPAVAFGPTQMTVCCLP